MMFGVREERDVENNMDIVSSTEYTRYKRIEGNRDLNLPILRKIMTSMIAMGFNKDKHITVNEKDEIIDGQHRLEVAKRLQIPFYLVVVAGAGFNDVIRSQIQKSWTPRNFVSAYRNRGNQHYFILEEFQKKYHLGCSPSAFVLNRGAYTLGQFYKIGESIEDGSFKVTSIEFAETFGELLKEIEGLSGSPMCKRSQNLKALLRVLEKIEPKEIIEKMKVSGKRIYSSSTMREGVKMYDDIINYHRQNRVNSY